MTDWISFWDTEHSIYVSARHRDVHYRGIAEDLRHHVPGPDAVVMDYGCGEALHAGLIASAAGRLILVEAAPGVLTGLTARFASNPRIEVVPPERLSQFTDRTFDLIALHSVAQYLSRETLDDLLRQFRRLLKTDGLLIVGDVIPPKLSPLADVLALLRLAWANGFFGAALAGLGRTVTSNYARLRTRIGLARYDAPAMISALAAAGFAAERAPANIGHNQQRMTFLARPVMAAAGNPREK
jgi:SAM-dependent methyltransferase